METESILKALERYDGTFPREALLAALEQPESVTPGLLEALRFAREHASDLPHDYFLHTWAMFLLAKFRETEAYPLIVDLFSFPGETLDRLHGETVSEDGARILASVCGGDTHLIEQLIENPEADEFARAAGMSALVTLVLVGERSREETVEYFRRLFRTGEADPGSFFWSALVSRANDLYPDLLMGEIRAAFEQDLVDPWFIDLDFVEETLEQGKEAALGERADRRYYRLVEDVIAETEWWHCFQPVYAVPPAPTGNAPASWSTPPGARPGLTSLEMAALAPPRQHAPAVVGPKPGRNDPCPCGSGLKYKRCCLRKHAT
jgi:hypothetical protein